MSLASKVSAKVLNYLDDNTTYPNRLNTNGYSLSYVRLSHYKDTHLSLLKGGNVMSVLTNAEIIDICYMVCGQDNDVKKEFTGYMKEYDQILHEYVFGLANRFKSEIN